MKIYRVAYPSLIPPETFTEWRDAVSGGHIWGIKDREEEHPNENPSQSQRHGFRGIYSHFLVFDANHKLVEEVYSLEDAKDALKDIYPNSNPKNASDRKKEESDRQKKMDKEYRDLCSIIKNTKKELAKIKKVEQPLAEPAVVSEPVAVMSHGNSWYKTGSK